MCVDKAIMLVCWCVCGVGGGGWGVEKGWNMNGDRLLLGLQGDYATFLLFRTENTDT